MTLRTLRSSLTFYSSARVGTSAERRSTPSCFSCGAWPFPTRSKKKSTSAKQAKEDNTLRVTLNPNEALGIDLAEDDLGKICHVHTDTQAHRAGIKTGMRLTAIDGDKFTMELLIGRCELRPNGASFTAALESEDPFIVAFEAAEPLEQIAATLDSSAAKAEPISRSKCEMGEDCMFGEESFGGSTITPDNMDASLLQSGSPLPEETVHVPLLEVPRLRKRDQIKAWFRRAQVCVNPRARVCVNPCANGERSFDLP